MMTLTNVLPPDEFEGASLTQPVSFTIGSDSSVTLSSTEVWVRNEVVYRGSVGYVAGWSTSSAHQTNSGVNGYDFRFVPPASKAWKRGELVPVWVTSSDAGGTQTWVWTFRVEGEELALSLWPMLLKSVRDKDGGEEGLLYKLIRMEGGLDDIWRNRMFDRAGVVGEMYDPYRVNAAWLPWLKAMVGLTRDLSFDPTEEQLRSIVALFPSLMKHKPSDLSVDYAVRMVTGNRFWVRDFFDLRMRADETFVAELLQGLDPNVLSFPSSTPSGEFLSFCSASPDHPCSHQFFISDLPTYYFPENRFTSTDQYAWLEITEWPADPSLEGFYEIESLVVGAQQGLLKGSGPPSPNAVGTAKWRLWGANSEFVQEVRVMDNPGGSGAIDRVLLAFFLGLVRPLSERYDLVYVAFLDRFEEVGNLEQWTTGGAGATVEASGVMTLASTNGTATIGLAQASLWGERSLAVAAKVTGSDAILEIRIMGDTDNYFWAEVDYGNQTVKLYKTVSGSPTQLGSTVLLVDLVPNYLDVWRCNVIASGSGFRLQVQYDGETILDEVEASPPVTTGTVVLAHGGGADDVFITFVEIVSLPADLQRIGPNP